MELNEYYDIDLVKRLYAYDCDRRYLFVAKECLPQTKELCSLVLHKVYEAGEDCRSSTHAYAMFWSTPTSAVLAINQLRNSVDPNESMQVECEVNERTLQFILLLCSTGVAEEMEWIPRQSDQPSAEKLMQGCTPNNAN